jgi:predicted GIY-YIG superfamily endonuclease
MKGTVYLLHFDSPYKHARHYVGFTKDLAARLEAHASGQGARLVQVIIEAGITFQLARVWTGTRKDERRLKNRKNAPRECPLCRKSQPQNGARYGGIDI